MDLAQELVDDFLVFLNSESEGGHTALSGYFDEWMIHGSGIQDTAGDYVLFLRVFALTAARFVEKSEDFGERGEAIVKLVELQGGDNTTLPPCLEPDFWKLYVFRRKYGEQPHRRSP